MSYTWAKVYIEILDDHKMGMLPDSLWRRVIELILLAKKHDKDGYLPGMIEMSWTLRISTEQLEADLTELSKLGIVELKEGNWYLTNFIKRQAADPVTERVRNFRKRNSERTGNDDVTNDVTQSYQTKTKTKTRQDKTHLGANAPAVNPARSELRFDSTPQGALMAQKLRSVFESKGRRPPEFYANAIQREAFLTAFDALGDRFASLLDSAMESDITDRARLLKWLKGCAKKNGKGHPTDESGLSVVDRAIQISAQHDEERTRHGNV